MHVFYLHGFASSSASSKALFLAERLQPFGITLQCPDFNLPDFSTLTTTRMLEQVDAAVAALPPGPVALIGSSLGAFVSWHAAARQPASLAATHPIARLVLLAPAFNFGREPMAGVGEAEVEEWRRTGSREFFHFAYNEPRRVQYALFDDALRYESATAVVTTPTLVFQGSRDALVDAGGVRAFAATRPNIELVELDDDHQLIASVPTIWERTSAFLDLHQP